jgi:Protein of unknown function (DUF2523)
MTKIGLIIDTFVAKAWSVVKFGAAALVARVLGAFGLTLVTFNGLMPEIKAFLSQYVHQLPASALNFIGAIGLDVAMTMIVSALSVRLAWKVFIVPKAAVAGLGAA